MKPVLFTVGGVPIPTYGALYLVAFLSSLAVFAGLGRRVTGLRFGRMFEIGFQLAIAGEIGSRLAFAVVEWDRFAAGRVSWRQFLFGGRVVFGGVLAGAAFAAYLFRRHRLPMMPTLDAGFTATALGMAIGRIGCLFAGCCYGKPTGAWWGITFTDPLAARLNGTPLGVPLHPTQPIQALLGFAVFGALLWMHGRPRRAGDITAVFLALTGGVRFLVEFLRGDPRGAAAGLATSQWIGLLMVALALAWFAARRRVSTEQLGPARRRSR
jgi:phosphatidylglycerol:prolipoprotein diacylglycerol transferase